MEILQETRDFATKRTFFSHVFNTTEEANSEIMNTVQYALLAIVPVVALNKLIQRFIPDADPDKSTIEITIEILLQVVAMFVGIILIHRIITYVPTYSGFKYEHLTMTNFILAFLMIVLSVQTKLGLKVNILYDRLGEMWNGASGSDERKSNVRNRVRIAGSSGLSAPTHTPSQADHLDTTQSLFPPAPVSSAGSGNGSYDHMMRGSPATMMADPGPMAANSVLGGSFGSFF